MAKARRKAAGGKKRGKAAGKGDTPKTAPAPPSSSRLSPPGASWLVVNRLELEQLLGCNDSTISDYLKAGMPAIERGGHGKPGVYDGIACLDWYRANRGGRNALEIAKTESAREDVILKRFKAGELAQALVRTQEVVALGQNFVKGWVALIRALPKQARRTGILATVEQEKQLAGLCRRVLEEASRWQVPAVMMQREADADDSADDPAA